MINQPTNYAPAMPVQPAQAQGPQFNAIKIDITGATVGANPAPMIMQPVQQSEAVGQNINYTA